MKLTIEKLPHGTVKVVLNHDAARKPLVLELAPPQLQLVLELLRAAGSAERFSFQLEL